MQNGNSYTGWITKALVVVACTVVLAAVLFPVFVVPRERQHVISCVSQMKQVALGLQMYVQDYDGRFPRASEWMDASYPYTKNKDVYRCSAFDRSQTNDFGYAFNASLSMKTLDKRKAPEKIVMIYDSNDLHWNANAPERTGMANPARHDGGNNFGYADGHVKREQLLTGQP